MVDQHTLVVLLPLVFGIPMPPNAERVTRRGRVNLPRSRALPRPPMDQGLVVKHAPLHLQVRPGQAQRAQQALYKALRLWRALHQHNGGDGLHRLPLPKGGAGDVAGFLRRGPQDQELLERGLLVLGRPL